MRRLILIRIWIFAAVAIVCAGCQQHSPGSIHNDGIYFAADEGSSGQGSDYRLSDGQWEVGDAIGVFMLSPGGSVPGDILTTDGSAADNRKYVYNGSDFAPATDADKMHFPGTMQLTAHAASFTAYYPWKPTGPGGLENFIYPVDLSDQSDPAAIDLLISAAPTHHSPRKLVQLNFRHQLSKLKLKILDSESTAGADFTTLDIVLKGVPVKAGYSLSDGSFTSTVAVDVNPYPVLAGSDYEFLVVPHSGVPGRSVEFTLGDDVFIWEIPANATFSSQRTHTWTITISKAGLSISQCTISDWEGTGSAPETGQAVIPGQNPQPGFDNKDIMYRVGDLYPDPDAVYSGGTLISGYPAEGIVYWLDETDDSYDGTREKGKKGRVVSLDETYSQWGIVTNSYTASTVSGLQNMIKMLTQYGSLDDHDIMLWAHEKNSPGIQYMDVNANDVWFVPSREELFILRDAWNGGSGVVEVAGMRTTFNGWLTAAGGEPINASNYYWAGSENGGNQGRRVLFETGSASNIGKANSHHVRAIMNFKTGN